MHALIAIPIHNILTTAYTGHYSRSFIIKIIPSQTWCHHGYVAVIENFLIKNTEPGKMSNSIRVLKIMCCNCGTHTNIGPECMVIPLSIDGLVLVEMQKLLSRIKNLRYLYVERHEYCDLKDNAKVLIDMIIATNSHSLKELHIVTNVSPDVPLPDKMYKSHVEYLLPGYPSDYPVMEKIVNNDDRLVRVSQKEGVFPSLKHVELEKGFEELMERNANTLITAKLRWCLYNSHVSYPNLEELYTWLLNGDMTNRFPKLRKLYIHLWYKKNNLFQSLEKSKVTDLDICASYDQFGILLEGLPRLVTLERASIGIKLNNSIKHNANLIIVTESQREEMCDMFVGMGGIRYLKYTKPSSLLSTFKFDRLIKNITEYNPNLEELHLDHFDFDQNLMRDFLFRPTSHLFKRLSIISHPSKNLDGILASFRTRYPNFKRAEIQIKTEKCLCMIYVPDSDSIFREVYISTKYLFCEV